MKPFTDEDIAAGIGFPLDKKVILNFNYIYV